jgi:hypothetical protein
MPLTSINLPGIETNLGVHFGMMHDSKIIRGSMTSMRSTPGYKSDSIARSSRKRISPSLLASEITKRTRPWLEVSA